MPQDILTPTEFYQAWPLLSDGERLDGFTLLEREEAEELIDQLDARQQCELLLAMPAAQRRIWMRYLEPDDAADLIQHAPEEKRAELLDMLDATARREVNALLAYAEDEAGGLMNPHYARLRPDMTVEEAITYLRRQTPDMIEHIYYAYVLDATQKLLGVVSLRELVMARPGSRVRELLEADVVTAPEGLDQEELGNLFAQHDLVAIPVVDDEGRMKGIVTHDDIVDVLREEATEDIHKIGGTAALEAPYLEVHLRELLAKRLPWLAGLLLLGIATVQVMYHFEAHIAQVTALALFVPMIIASGGNSGTQATTLVVRAMALEEVRLRDWWRVVRREVAVGLILGGSLGLLGGLVVLTWHLLAAARDGVGFGPHWRLLAFAIGLSILSVALWGTIVGSMLPFLLRRLGLDPASASAPLVATIIDATGLLLYFTITMVILRGAVG